MNASDDFIHNWQKLKTIKVPFNKWVGEQIGLQMSEGLFFTDKKERAIKPWEDREKPYLPIEDLDTFEK